MHDVLRLMRSPVFRDAASSSLSSALVHPHCSQSCLGCCSVADHWVVSWKVVGMITRTEIHQGIDSLVDKVTLGLPYGLVDQYRDAKHPSIRSYKYIIAILGTPRTIYIPRLDHIRTLLPY